MHCGRSPQCARIRSACGRPLRVAVHAGALWSRCMPGRGEGSSRTMLGPLVFIYLLLLYAVCLTDAFIPIQFPVSSIINAVTYH